MDIVYFIGPEHTEELRYSLRSVCENVPHDRLVFLGTPPEWVQDAMIIEGAFDTSKFWALHSKFRMLGNPRIPLSDKIINFDDDMYVLDPITKEIPPHRVAEKMKRINVQIRNQSVSNDQVIENTWKFLDDNGVKDPVELSVHTPRVYDRDLVAELIEKDEMVEPYLWRKIYANYFKLDSVRLEMDVKVIHKDHWVNLQRWPQGFLSSYNASFNIVEDYLKEKFPDKCQYEE